MQGRMDVVNEWVGGPVMAEGCGNVIGEGGCLTFAHITPFR